MSYFSKTHTGGAFASRGFSYQDACALFYAVKYLEVPGFKSIGLETDDDFCILNDTEKIFVQVKDTELALPFILNHIGKNKILIGSKFNSKVETFASHLSHFRNNQNSDEDENAKLIVNDDFDELLKNKFGKNRGVPPSWHLEHIPRMALSEMIGAHINSWSEKKNQRVSIDDCIDKLLSVFAKAREQRNYVKKSEIAEIITAYSANYQITSTNYVKFPLPEAYEVINSIGANGQELLDSFSQKIREADSLLKNEKFSESYDIYSSISQFIKSEKIYICCAAICQLMNKDKEAIDYCERALLLNAKSIESLIILGTIYSDAGDNKRALDYLESAYLNTSKNGPLLYNLGVLHIRLRKTEKAIGYFKESILVDNSKSSAYLNLSICQFNKGNYDDALSNVDMALGIEPGMPNALSHKGEIQRFFGNNSDAIELFKRCLSKEPENFVSLKGLALCNIVEGDPIGAAMLIKLHENEIKDSLLETEFSFVDIGWTKTTVIRVLPFDGKYLKVVYNELEVLVPIPFLLDKIGIGLYQWGVATYPVILKEYEVDENYHEACNKIKGDGITKPSLLKGYVSDQSSYCEINLDFDHFTIFGRAPKSDSQGFKQFKKHYTNEFLLLLKSAATGDSSKFILDKIEILH